MYTVQRYDPHKRRYIAVTKRHYYGDALDTAQQLVRDKIPARVRMNHDGKTITVWDHDPYESAHATEHHP